MNLLTPPSKDDRAAMERYFDTFVAAEHAARLAVRAIVKGGKEPDLDALENGARVLEMLRTGFFHDGRVKLTEDDIAAARHLVDLVRAGVSNEEVTAAALRVHKIINRPKDPSFARPREEYERVWTDALRRLGIEPTEDHLRDVRRLATLSVEDAEDLVEVQLESDEICRRLFPRQILTETEERAMEERERHLTHVMDALDRLAHGLQVILDGGAADIDALAAGAEALEDFAAGKVAGPHPVTDDDVAAARHLVNLVRAGASREEIVAAALLVHRAHNIVEH